jgi:4-hydroxy-tetrahydrodipicolinate synthase
MAQLGLCTDEVRLPIVACSEAARAEVLTGMRDTGLI